MHWYNTDCYFGPIPNHESNQKVVSSCGDFYKN